VDVTNNQKEHKKCSQEGYETTGEEKMRVMRVYGWMCGTGEERHGTREERE